jgi:hypothetical protein
MFLFLIGNPKGAWQAQLCGFIYFSGLKAGEVPGRQSAWMTSYQ